MSGPVGGCYGDKKMRLRIYYGGAFARHCTKYVGGRQEIIEVDPDRMNFWEIMDIIRELGYSNVSKLYYRVPSKRKLPYGLNLVYDDVSVLDMFKKVTKPNMEVALYCEHGESMPAAPDDKMPAYVTRVSEVSAPAPIMNYVECGSGMNVEGQVVGNFYCENGLDYEEGVDECDMPVPQQDGLVGKDGKFGADGVGDVDRADGVGGVNWSDFVYVGGSIGLAECVGGSNGPHECVGGNNGLVNVGGSNGPANKSGACSGNGLMAEQDANAMVNEGVQKCRPFDGLNEGLPEGENGVKRAEDVGENDVEAAEHVVENQGENEAGILTQVGGIQVENEAVFEAENVQEAENGNEAADKGNLGGLEAENGNEAADKGNLGGLEAENNVRNEGASGNEAANSGGNEAECEEEVGAVGDDEEDNVILVDADEEDSCNDDEEFELARKNVQETVNRRREVDRVAAEGDVPDDSATDEDDGGNNEINGAPENGDEEAMEIDQNAADDGVSQDEVNVPIPMRKSRGIQEQSVYYDSSDDAMSVHTDEEGSDVDSSVRRAEDKSKLYDPEKPFSGFFIGQQFLSVKHLRGAITRYSVLRRYKIVYRKNDKNRVQVKCSDQNCEWYMFSSLSKTIGRFTLNVYNGTHTCKQVTRNTRVTSKVILEELRDLILDIPNIKAKTMVKLIWKQLKTKVTVSQCKLAKHFLFKDRHKEFMREYNDVWRYVAELQTTNPGTTIELQNYFPQQGAQPHFKRIYICFEALKRGFLGGCRPIIGVDGCFLKGDFKGELLCAVGRDGNNQMFPIAWAIVETESTSTWTWFFDLLRKDLDMGEGRGWTIMSDQQKGLVAAVQDVFPQAEQRMCVRHLYANWRKAYKGGDLRIKYWGAAKSPNICKMWDSLSDLAEMSPEGYVSLSENLHPKYWCRAFFPTHSCCDLVDNNICETFNGVIIEARRKPVISMLEDIRVYLMNRMVQKRALVNKWRQDCAPRIWAKVEKNIEFGGDWDFEWNGDDGYEVSWKEEKYVVKLQKRECTCRRWQLRGIPCPHACACIAHEGHDVLDYVSDYYKSSMYVKTYSHMLQPVRGMQDWPMSTLMPLLPPVDRRMPGRPKLHKRRKEEGERQVGGKQKKSKKGVHMVCTICNQPDHNKRTCIHNPNRKKGQKNGTRGDEGQPAGPSKNTTPKSQQNNTRGDEGQTGPAKITPQRPTKRATRPAQGQAAPTIQKTPQNVNAPPGFGLYINPNNGTQVLNPGRPSQQIVEGGTSARKKGNGKQNKATNQTKGKNKATNPVWKP